MQKWFRISVVVIAVVVCLLAYFKRAPESGLNAPEGRASLAEDQTNSGRPLHQGERISPIAPAPRSTSSSGSSLNSNKDKRRAQLVDLLRQANQPVEFYGQVLDQEDHPIAGVKVTMKLSAVRERIPGLPDGVFEDHTGITDDYGRFKLDRTEGTLLTIKSLEKEGYESSRKPFPYFWYRTGEPERHNPKSNSPIVFRMWKKLPAERLVHANAFYGIVPDGRPYTIDLLERKKREGLAVGDLIIQIARAKGSGQSKYDWSFSIEVIGGGILESTNEFMFLAPEHDYYPSFRFVAPAAQPGWKERVTKDFYVKSRNGQVFTRMLVEVFSDYQNQAVFSVDYYSNPSGSRVLEYDPSQNWITQ